MQFVHPSTMKSDISSAERTCHSKKFLTKCILTSGPGPCAALAWAVPPLSIDLTHLNILRTEARSGPGASEQPGGACGQLVHGREAVNLLLPVFT